MSDFDPQDVVSVAPAKPAAAPVSDFDPADVVAPTQNNSDFHPADVVSIKDQPGFPPKQADVTPPGGDPNSGSSPARGGSESAYEKLRGEMDRGFVKNVTEAPLVGGQSISDAEIEAIAHHHGVDPEYLRTRLTLMGGDPGWENLRGSDVPLGAAGAAGLIGLGVPQKLYKKTQSPNQERALDDLQELAARRMSLLGEAAKAGAPIGGVVAEGAGLATKLAHGAALGTVAGGANARKGQEAQGAAIGAGVGTVLGGVAAGAGKLLGRGAEAEAGQASGEAALAADRVTKRGGADFQHGVEEAVTSRENADAIIRNRVLGEAEHNTSSPDFDASDVVSTVPQLNPHDASEIANAYNPSMVKRLMDSSTEEGAAFIEKQRRDPDFDLADLRQAAEKEVAETEIRNATADFSRDVFGKVVQDPAAELRTQAGAGPASGQGVEYMNKRLQGVLDQRTRAQYLQDHAIQSESQGWGRQLGLGFGDEQYRLRGMDEKWRGLGAEEAHKDINAGLNRMSYPLQDMTDDIRSIFRKNVSEGLDKESTHADTILQKVQSGLELTPAEERIARPFIDYFRESLDKLDKLAREDNLPPLGIKRLPNYIPERMVAPNEARQIMGNRVQHILDDANAQLGAQFTDLAQIPPEAWKTVISSDPAHSETLHALHLLSRSSDSSPSGISRAFKDTFLNRDYASRYDIASKAATERTGLVPEFLREKNLYRLADSWTRDTLRNLYLRNGLDKLRNVAQTLDTLRATKDADHVRALISDIRGVRQDTAGAAVRRAMDSFNRAMDEKIAASSSPVQKAVYSSVKAVPAVLQSLGKNVYGNLIGAANMKVALLHLANPITQTIPELGAYGVPLALRGALRMGRDMPLWRARIRSMGLEPAGHAVQDMEYLREGIARSLPGRVSTQALNGMAQAGMLLVNKSRELTRGLAFGMSEMMAHDVLHGSPSALAALEKFPTSVQRDAREAIANHDVGSLVQAIATHINNSTQYNFNKASMSAYGRFMGPLFSQFTKYPTAMLGATTEALASQGAAGGAAKIAQTLVAPWVLLEGVDYLMGEHRTDFGLSDRSKKLFGSEGLSGLAPVESLGRLAHGEFPTPPAIDTAMKLIVDPLRYKDNERALSGFKRAVSNGLYTFAPGGVGGWIRFVTDDLVTDVTGERPEGTDFLERTRSGMNRLRGRK